MSGVLKYVSSRVASSLFTLWAISIVVFVVLQQLVPGNVADIMDGSGDATPAQVHAEEVKLGLTPPILDQYGTWLGHTLTGNLGVAPLSGQSISQVIAQQAPISFELAFLGLLIAIVLGVPVGILSAIHRSSAGTDVLIRLPFLLVYATPCSFRELYCCWLPRTILLLCTRSPTYRLAAALPATLRLWLYLR